MFLKLLLQHTRRISEKRNPIFNTNPTRSNHVPQHAPGCGSSRCRQTRNAPWAQTTLQLGKPFVDSLDINKYLPWSGCDIKHTICWISFGPIVVFDWLTLILRRRASQQCENNHPGNSPFTAIGHQISGRQTNTTSDLHGLHSGATFIHLRLALGTKKRHWNNCNLKVGPALRSFWGSDSLMDTPCNEKNRYDIHLTSNNQAQIEWFTVFPPKGRWWWFLSVVYHQKSFRNHRAFPLAEPTSPQRAPENTARHGSWSEKHLCPMWPHLGLNAKWAYIFIIYIYHIYIYIYYIYIYFCMHIHVHM